VDSKAIAVVIIGVGIMVLIISAAIGAPADGMIHTFSGWPAEAHVFLPPVVPTVLAMAVRALPLVETDIRPQDEDLACTVAIELTVPAGQSPGPDSCTFVGQYGVGQHGAVRGGLCASRFVRHCTGDLPPPETEPPAIQDVRNQASPSPR
jgi:hypothetical protein